MALPQSLLEAIVRNVPDEEDRRRVALEWTAVLPRLEAASARIRTQVHRMPCRCDRPAETTPGGRCSLCFGKAAG
jgi:hypothetical protein